MTPTPRPRFRTDLVAEPIEEDGHRYIDVVDPDTGNGFRFYEVEYSLACAMDGARDVPGLVQWAKEELGIEPSASELATVISTLGDLGYLDVTTTAAAPTEYAEELVPGVVAAPRPARPAPVEDIELGHAGTDMVADQPLPRADFELGEAGGVAAPAPPPMSYGAGPELGEIAPPSRELVMEFEAPTPPPAELPSPKLRPSTRPDIEDDGPTNLPRPQSTADFEDEVSVDLSDHLAISASDVKEAVRASKVMKAVELPADLAAQLDDAEARARAEAERVAAERAAAERAAAEAVAPPAVELPRPPVGVSRPKSTSERPVEKPTPAPVPAKEPVPTARSGVSGGLIFLLVLVLLVAGAAAVWKLVLEKPWPWEKAADTAVTPGKAGGGQAGPGEVIEPPPLPPPPPPPPSATLAEVPGTPADVVAGQVGVVTFAAADAAVVAAGDELVRFGGNPAWAGKLKGLDFDIDVRVPKQIADATAKRDAAQAANQPAKVKAAEATIAERTTRLEQKTAERDKIRAQMDALAVKAPVAGTVAMKVAKGARVTAEQVIATVTPPPVLTATFTLPAGGKTYAADASVRVAVKASPEQKANCTVGAVAGPQITVVCPPDAGIPGDTEIVLE